MDFAFTPEALLQVLPIIGIAYLGIFLVTTVIITAVAALNFLTRSKDSSHE